MDFDIKNNQLLWMDNLDRIVNFNAKKNDYNQFY